MGLQIVDPSIMDVEILSQASNRCLNHLGRRYVTTLLDSFLVLRSGTTYNGLVIEVLGTQIKRALQEASKIKMTIIEARRASKQIALGLAHLHECYITLASM